MFLYIKSEHILELRCIRLSNAASFCEIMQSFILMQNT